ncbi:chaperone protein DNAJ, putatative, partial [Trypanosoma grayi]|uniref:chaperone protein DNAJ, putatative n=1 Tax=Trypanosoma grayi TaxID=71804 RepID=UPI0004F46460
MFVDYYALLNLHPSCSAKEVREAFKRLALLHHPDRVDDGCGEHFREIKDAYDVLSDPARRYLYDLGYAEILWMQQRQQQEAEQRRREAERLAELLRRQPTRPPPPRKDAHAELTARCSSTDGSTLASRTPLSASRRTLAPTRPGSADKQKEVVAAQAIPRQGSALMAVRGSRAAEPQRSETPVGLQKIEAPHAHQTTSDSSLSDVRFAPESTGSSSHGQTEDGLLGQKQRSQQHPMEEKQQQQQRRQVISGRRFSGSSVIVPKKTTLQWGVEKQRPQPGLVVPAEGYLHTSVRKTWKVFFHLPETA